MVDYQQQTTTTPCAGVEPHSLDHYPLTRGQPPAGCLSMHAHQLIHRYPRAILQINLIASWFNYINRVADGLGVGK